MWAGAALAAPLYPVNHADWMVKKSYLTAPKDGNLQLERAITLAETLVILAKAKGEAPAAAAGAKNWADPYLAWGEKAGAISAEQAKQPAAALSSAQLNEIGKKLNLELALAEKAQVTRGEFIQALGEALTEQVTIAHTNDVHGRIVEDKNQKEFGYAKIATLLKQWRADT